MNQVLDDPRGKAIHLVGIKGSGMTALAEVLAYRGARISGSDVAESFYTDEILASIGIHPKSPFRAENVPLDTELVIRSAAYSLESNPELVEARERSLPIIIYPEALGALSSSCDASGVAGGWKDHTSDARVGKDGWDSRYCDRWFWNG